MAKRFYNPDIFNEDWFIDMPEHYKLFWLYIKAKCDHGGFWRVNKNQYKNISTKMPLFDDFLRAVNHEDDEETNRVIVVDKRTWFIPSHITEQCGHIFNPSVGAHRGVLHLLVVNKIRPAQVKDFDWRGIENIDYELISKLVLSKSWGTLVEHLDNSIVKGIGIRKVNKEEESAERNHKTGFQMQRIYDMDWAAYQNAFRPKKLTEEGFTNWKGFVDWVIQMEFQELFECKFITPADFNDLVLRGFAPEKWEAVLRKILGTGIKPEHNLYFRIPDFAEYLQKRRGPPKNADIKTGGSNVNNNEKDYTGGL